jgi:hypothetical protein
VFKDYNDRPGVEKMVNNGHSVTFTIEPAEGMDYPKVRPNTKQVFEPATRGCIFSHV